MFSNCETVQRVTKPRIQTLFALGPRIHTHTRYACRLLLAKKKNNNEKNWPLVKCCVVAVEFNSFFFFVITQLSLVYRYGTEQYTIMYVISHRLHTRFLLFERCEKRNTVSAIDGK